MDFEEKEDEIMTLLKNKLTGKVKFQSQKEIRCEKFKKNEKNIHIFTDNSKKEDLIMRTVKEFDKVYKMTNGENVPLLFALNEAGKEKLISSFIKPLKTPYIDLYEFSKCAEFISMFISYELLELTRKPRLITSPMNVVKWQFGDSAEIAILYCSLMLGSGYDSTVIYGRGKDSLTLKREGLNKYSSLKKDLPKKSLLNSL